MKKNSKGINQDTIQEFNRSLIISLLRKQGMCSRVQLANTTGLKQATVTNIINDFIHWGFVKEVGFLNGSKGRRSIGIAINTDNFRVIGVRIARKYYSVGLFDLTGTLHKLQRVETNLDDQPKEIFSNIAKMIQEFINENQSYTILSIGVAIPGPFIQKEGRIGLMTEAEGWKDILIKKDLEELYHIPVILEHDANAGVYTQQWHSKGASECEVLIYVAVGQGIGAGIMINGEVMKGSLGTAGEIGHTCINFNGLKCSCGNTGCLEKYCSSIAFMNSVNSTLKLNMTFEQIKELTKQGDKVCLQKYIESCEYLGIGIVNLINNFNPDMIILGDEMAHIEPKLMYETICKTVKDRIIPEIWANIKIGVSNIKNDSILHGAAIVAINEVFENPSGFINEN
jgi:Transcriptional regulator/sugar kinase